MMSHLASCPLCVSHRLLAVAMLHRQQRKLEKLLQQAKSCGRPLVVGVFLNQSAAFINDIAMQGDMTANAHLLQHPLFAASGHRSPLRLSCVLDVMCVMFDVTVELDVIQLHGEEPHDFALDLCRPVIRGVPVLSDSASYDSVLQHLCGSQQQQLQFEGISMLLLDTKIANSGATGGTGQCFDWNIAKRMSQQVTAHHPMLRGQCCSCALCYRTLYCQFA